MEAAARLELRLQPEQKARLRRAATVLDVSVADLVRDSALARADEVLAAESVTVVPRSFYDDLLRALDRPTVANKALRHALADAAETVDQR